MKTKPKLAQFFILKVKPTTTTPSTTQNPPPLQIAAKLRNPQLTFSFFFPMHP